MIRTLLFRGYSTRIYLLQVSFILLFLATGLAVRSQDKDKDIVVALSQVILLRTIPLHSARIEAPVAVDPNALYSNVTTFSGQGFVNAGAALQSGNTITTLVADSLGLIGTPPFTVGSFTFSVVNFDAANVTARPRIRFYAADGPGGSPGTLITGLSFSPITFNAGSIQLFGTGPLATPFPVTGQAIWAGITFDDNTGATGATLAQLNNLGQGFFGPIDRGNSTDDLFVTDAPGSFLADNPTGSTGNVGGSPLANFGWEIISAIPLPVTLYNFKAQQTGLVNSLSWSTSQELNSNYFTIERSIDGISFSPLGKVKASGNSNIVRNYQFNDANPVRGTNYYRIRITDIDNSSKYSNVITVKNMRSVSFSLYPNPVLNTMVVSVNAEKAGAGNVKITDMNGRVVYKKEISVTQGENSFPVDVSNFSRGNYSIQVGVSSGNFTAKFNKQ